MTAPTKDELLARAGDIKRQAKAFLAWRARQASDLVDEMADPPRQNAPLDTHGRIVGLSVLGRRPAAHFPGARRSLITAAWR